MVITCQRCQTAYELDDGLIPSTGAPVQCTKCAAVFTAYPPPPVRPIRRTVMMFAGDAQATALAPPPPAPAVAPPPPVVVAPLPPVQPVVTAPPAVLPTPFAATSPLAAAPAPVPPAPAPVPAAVSPLVASWPSAWPQPPAAPPSRDSVSWPGRAVPASSPTVRVPPEEIAGILSKQAPSEKSAPAPADQTPTGKFPVQSARALTPAPISAAAAASPAVMPTPAVVISSPPPVRPVTGSIPVAKETSPGATPAAAKPEPPPPGLTPTPKSVPVAPPAEKAPISIPGISKPGKMTGLFFARGDAVDKANQAAQLAASGEANRKPGQTAIFMEAASLEQELVRKSRTGLLLGLTVVAAIVLAIVASFVVPTMLGPAGADRAAVKQWEKAISLLKQDDAADVAAADAALAEVLKGHPKYLDAQADRALALEIRWEALSHQVRALRDRYEALEREVAIYNSRRQPADWMAKANADISLMKQMHGQYGELVSQEEALGREAFKLANAAYNGDHKNPSALRALAFYYADQNDADKSATFVKKYEMNAGKDGWVYLAREELAASPPASEQKRSDGMAYATEALAKDPGLVRARYLKVVMDVGVRREDDAKGDAAALVAAAPKHEGGKQLVDYLDETLKRAEAERLAAAARAAEEASQAAAATAANGKKKTALLPRRGKR